MDAPDLNVPKEMMFDFFSHHYKRLWRYWDPVPEWFKIDDKIKFELFNETVEFMRTMVTKDIEVTQAFLVHFDKKMEIMRRAF